MARQDWDMSIQPTAASEILGNADVVSRMMEYIEKKSEEQVMLVHGPSGIGKSEAVRLVLHELGYKQLTIHLSGEHTLKSVESMLQKCVGCRSILDWGKKQKFAIVVDELECLQVFQKAVLMRLLQIHSPTKGIAKTSKARIAKVLKNYVPLDMPVVFICNVQYHRSLEEIEKYAEKFCFDYPSAEEQCMWCQSIAMIHDIRITPNVISLVIAKGGDDIRQLSHLMFTVKQEQRAGHNLVKIRKTLRAFGEKEVQNHLHDLLHNTIVKNTSIDQAMKNYSEEKILLPWMIFENAYTYLQNAPFECSSLIGDIANSVSECDLFWEAAHRGQNYELEDYYAAIATWRIPTYIRKELPQHLRKRVAFTFPSIMIKRSQMRLHESYQTYLTQTMNTTTNDIHHIWNMIRDMPLDHIANFATMCDLDWIQLDRLNKLGSFHPKKGWNATKKKQIKKHLASADR